MNRHKLWEGALNLHSPIHRGRGNLHVSIKVTLWETKIFQAQKLNKKKIQPDYYVIPLLSKMVSEICLLSVTWLDSDVINRNFARWWNDHRRYSSWDHHHCLYQCTKILNLCQIKNAKECMCEFLHQWLNKEMKTSHSFSWLAFRCIRS